MKVVGRSESQKKILMYYFDVHLEDEDKETGLEWQSQALTQAPKPVCLMTATQYVI